MTRHRLYTLLHPGATEAAARAFRGVHHAMVAAGILITATTTVAVVRDEYDDALDAVFLFVAAFFLVEFLLRLIAAPEAPGADHRGAGRARLAWLVSLGGVFDLIGALPGIVDLVGNHDARLFSFIWIFKYVRYSPGLASLGRVIRHARHALLSVLLGFIVVLLAAANLAYLFERSANPEGFGSIPAALWWAIVTMTTTGYGDVVPHTLAGRMLGGLVMMSGILVFALWAGIMASGYADEMRRRAFLETFELVAKVPFFHDLGVAVIAEVTRLLRARDYPAGAVIVRRGEPGDCMYFVAEGEVAVQIQPEPVLLGPGQFFGEMALLTGAPRTATIVANEPCTLLALDIVDFHELRGRQPELARAIHEEADRRIASAATPAAPIRTDAELSLGEP